MNPAELRILVVSSHYPPNFVSGGTLQPWRLARGLATRGHRVSVFAGWHGDRPPFDEWDEVDDGIPVHWIVPPSTAWADPLTWDDRRITDRFRTVVEAVRPDVVHVHSLQGLGAGLLPVAKEVGAAVVVTMHDFWWVCGRQFLADRSIRPCSVVVSAGACGCEVDEAWRRNRDVTLRPLLDAADLVLTPSASAARILRSNGVAADRLAVDENGLPDETFAQAVRVRTAGSTRPAVSPAVRFLYAGGPHPVKGPGHLLDAARELARATLDWSLTAHGFGEYLADARRSVDGLPIEVRPMFDPADLGSVLAQHDVLVVPSVSLETFSLLTREALVAGLPVICTDNPGPAEAVVDGVNGLIVPVAEPPALARAMRRVVDEPGLLEGLRRGTSTGASNGDGTGGTGTGLALRTIDEQVESLERRFAELVASARPAASGAAVPRRVAFVVGINGAPLRYRAMFPAEALGLRGVTSEIVFYRDPTMPEVCARADVVVMYRVPATPPVVDAITAAHARGRLVVFDVDDLIVDPELAAALPALARLPAVDRDGFVAGVRRYRTTLELCDAFVGSTPALVDEVARLTGLPSFELPNGYGLELARICDLELQRPRRRGPVRIGFLSGTITHAIDWEHIEPVVIDVLDARTDVELWLVGHVTPTKALKRLEARVVRVPFKRWDQLPPVLRDLDVNMAPLAMSPRFDEAKSAVKWLEAALCATPTVASPTEPFRRVIDHGRTGLLASTPDEWRDALLRLVDDADLRLKIGTSARRSALLDASPWLQGDRYLRILEDAASTPRRDSAEPAWLPIVEAESSLEIVLDGYPDHPRRGASTTSMVTKVRRLARRVVRVVRRDGVVATADRAVRLLVARVRSRRTWTA